MLSLNAIWKKIIIIQIIGYLLSILMCPISIKVIIDERIDGVTFIVFPIISFIVWFLLIVVPVIYAYTKRIEHKNVCYMVLWVPPTMLFAICMVNLLIHVIPLLW